MKNFKKPPGIKAALLILFLLTAFVSHAQTLRVTTSTVNGITTTDSLWYTPAEYYNHVYGNLNLSGLSSGYLLEKSLYRRPVSWYDGKNLDDSTLHSVSDWYSLYLALQGSNVNSYATLPTADTLSKIAAGYYADGKMPIFLVNNAYQYIRSDALSLGLFTTSTDSTILYDNPTRTISPYYTSRLCVGSAYVADGFSSTGEVLFILPSALFKTDTAVNQIQIDFGDGLGYRDVNPDVPISVNYSSSGTKTIKITNGDFVCFSTFVFTKTNRYYEATAGDIVPSGDDENSLMRINTNGVHTNGIPRPPANITYNIVYGCSDKVLDKPVLIVQGLEIDRPQSFDDIFNTVNRGTNAYLQPLIQNGYDIISVKFTQNHASIIDNATALENLIKYINLIKTGNQPLSIIGLSMGGLITRYCLKSMEDRSITHNVAQFISFDAPHQGLNVPYGFQTLFEAANNSGTAVSNNPVFKFVYDALNSTAAKQLLQIHYNDPTNIRQSFASTYAAQGYPSQCTNYAIANGRSDGVGPGVSPGAQMFNLDAGAIILGIFLSNHQQFWAMNTSNSQLMSFSQGGLATIWPFSLITHLKRRSVTAWGSSSILFENSPGSTGTAHTIYGQQARSAFSAVGATFTTYGNNVYNFVPTVSALDLNNQSIGSGNYVSQNPTYNFSSIDIVGNHITPFQGGVITSGANVDHLTMSQSIANFIVTAIYGSIPSASCSTTVCSTTPTFTPATTAAFCQYQDQLVTVGNFPNGSTINWTMPTGVTLVSGQGTTQIHIVSNISGNITLGVTIGYPGCTAISYPVYLQVTPNPMPVVTFTLTGTDCTAATVTATAPGATSFDWMTTGGILINGSSTTLTGTTSSQITLFGNNPGSVFVRAYYSGSCGATPYTEHCFIPCNGTTGPMTIPYSDPLTNEPLEAYVNAVDQATSYLWYSSGTLIETTNDPYLYTHNWQCDTHSLTCYAVTPCGLSASDSQDYTGECFGRFSYVAYPNPTTSVLNISPQANAKTTNSKGKAIPAEEYTYALYNKKGQIVRSGNSAKQNAKIDVRGLEKGIYFLHVKHGKTLDEKQIVVN